MCKLASTLEERHLRMAEVIGGGDEVVGRGGQAANLPYGFEDTDALGVRLDHEHFSARVGDEIVEGVQVPHAREQVNRLARGGAGLQPETRQEVKGDARPDLFRLVRERDVQADE